MSYRELAPPPELAHLVLCLWERTGTGQETVVTPDGCVDVVVRDGVAHVAGPDTGPDMRPELADLTGPPGNRGVHR